MENRRTGHGKGDWNSFSTTTPVCQFVDQQQLMVQENAEDKQDNHDLHHQLRGGSLAA